MCPDPTASRRDVTTLPSFSRPTAAEFDPDGFSLAEADLRQSLDQFLRGASAVLDLSAHGEALRQGPDELMERFADACRRARRRVAVLRLPAIELPSWLGAFPQAVCQPVADWADAGAPLALAA